MVPQAKEEVCATERNNFSLFSFFLLSKQQQTAKEQSQQ
jgi:hypothetical protein